MINAPPASTRHSDFFLLYAALLAAVLMALPVAALAQSGGGTRGPGTRANQPEPASPRAPGAQPGADAVLFEGEPYPIEDLGLSLFLPVGCTINRSFIPGGRQAFMIEPEDNTWVLQVFIERVTTANMTPRIYLDNVIQQHHNKRQDQTTFVAGQKRLKHEAIDRTDTLLVSDLTGSRVYMKLPDRASSLVTGYAVFQLEEREFLAFQFDALTEEFERTRPLFEMIVAASRFDRPDPEQRAERAATMTASKRFLDGLSAQDLESALPDKPVILRLYEPAKTGADADAKELGYQKVHIRTGQLGETTGRARHTWSAAERQFGFIASVDGRFLEGAHMVDVNATIYLSRDRSEETWSLLTTVTGPNRETGRVESVSNNQTVLRNGPRMTSRIVMPTASPIVRDWVIPEDKAYISGVEIYLLPRLVANADLAAPFSFYHFHTVRGSISLRRDTFKKTPAGWTREEIRSDLEEPNTSIYAKKGDLIRTTLPNGSVIEPIDAERLVRIWKSKGLPIR